MSSLVLELQREAMDSRSDLGNLLRKAMVVATKLQLQELAAWCKSELNGYSQGAKVPEYRLLTGEVKVYNPYNGIWMELTGGSSVVRTYCSQSIAEVQHLSNGEGMIGITALPQVAQRVHAPVTPPRIILNQTSLFGILDAVRNAVLDWTLRLEQDGVLGEGMTFTVEEKRTAMSNITNYNIGGNFNGVLGNVTSQHAQIGSFSQIEPQLKDVQISADERRELGNLMEAIPQAPPNEKRHLVARGVEWVARNADALGTLSTALHEWFKNA